VANESGRTNKEGAAERPVETLPNEAEERMLVEAAQRDRSRFAELYERNFDRVYAYVIRRVRNREEAEDLTSEVFQQALANLPRFEWRGVPFVGWLLRIAANAIADRWQHADRDRIQAVQQVADDGAMKDIERRATLYQLVRTLPADQRRVIVMRFVEQHSLKETAQQLERTEGAIKQLQFRALQTLRAGMEGANE
jgi:RNA polymerase sigma-70 factor, ECF subfamily